MVTEQLLYKHGVICFPLWLCLKICEKAVYLGDLAMPALIYTMDYLLKIRGEGEQKGEGEKKKRWVLS